MAGKGGRPRDPTRARRGTGHREKPGEAKVTNIVVLPPLVDDDDRIDGNDPTSSAANGLDPPIDLPAAMHDLWRMAVSELEPRGLRAADLESLRQMCLMAYRARQAFELISQYGFLVKGARGPIVNPAVKAERDAVAAYQRIATEFSLTLASRVRLGLMQLAGASILRTLNDDLDR